MLWPTAVPLTNTAKHESTPSKRTRVDPPESQPRGSAKRLRYSPVGLRSGTRGGSSGKGDRKSTRLNSSHGYISDAGFCLNKTLLEPHMHRLAIRARVQPPPLNAAILAPHEPPRAELPRDSSPGPLGNELPYTRLPSPRPR